MISEMFAHGFIQRAFIGGVLVSLCAALLGVSLVLKRYSMIGDGLSHVSFGALSIAIAFGFAPIKFSIPIFSSSCRQHQKWPYLQPFSYLDWQKTVR